MVGNGILCQLGLRDGGQRRFSLEIPAHYTALEDTV